MSVFQPSGMMSPKRTCWPERLVTSCHKGDVAGALLDNLIRGGDAECLDGLRLITAEMQKARLTNHVSRCAGLASGAPREGAIMARCGFAHSLMLTAL
jgi:hypothetical protein